MCVRAYDHVCLCSCGYMSVSWCMWPVCKCMWRPKVTSHCSSSGSIHLCLFETGSLSDLELLNRLGWLDSEPQESVCLHLCSCGMAVHHKLEFPGGRTLRWRTALVRLICEHVRGKFSWLLIEPAVVYASLAGGSGLGKKASRTDANFSSCPSSSDGFPQWWIVTCQ